MQKKHEVKFSKTTQKNPEETKSVQNIPQENKSNKGDKQQLPLH